MKNHDDIHEIVEDFLDVKQEESEWCENTVAAYRRDVLQFLTFLDKNPSEIIQADLRRYKKYLHKTFPLTIQTRNRKIVAIRRFLSFLQDNHYLVTPLRLLRPEKEQEQSFLFEHITVGEFTSLVRATEQRNDYRAKALFFALRYTGARVSEILQLPKRSIKDRTITIIGKGDKKRTIFISRELQKIFKEYLQHDPTSSEWLFPGENGHLSRQRVYQIVQYYAGKTKLAKVKAHPHAFRHLFCLEMIPLVGIETTADMAGHESINTTRKYAHKSKREILGALDRAILKQQQEFKLLRQQQNKAAKKRNQASRKNRKRK